MKQILFTMALLLTLGKVFSQSTYTQVQDSLMQHLDKTMIPTGILYDRVYPWVSLPLLNSSNDTIDYDFVRQAWHELELASYTLTEDMHTLDSIDKRIRKNTTDGKGISIGYIDVDFNSIDSNALLNGALILGTDGFLYDGDSSTIITPPAYLNHHIQLPLIAANILEGDSVKFYFDPEIKLQNTLNTIAYMELETSGGSRIIIMPGDEKWLNISGISTPTIDIQVKVFNPYGELTAVWDNRFRNRNVMVLTSTSVTTNICVSEVEPFWSGNDLKFQGYDESIATQGKGEYKIFYRRLGGNWDICATNISKPVIIVDGFDPEDKRKITKDGDTLGIWDLLNYNNKHLGDSLRYAGFDVIVLNFPTYNTIENNEERFGGADYIERNAMVLVKLIQKINEKLEQQSSNEKIVIIGPSMGGQISRYALAYMEHQNALGTPKMNHNTRLFVSFDSPHKGANIPISAQQALYSLGYINNQEVASKQYESQLRSKAARQLLIEQMDGLNKTAVFHQTYYNNLNTEGLPGSEGWPLNLRKISLINGNAAGINTGIAGNKIMYLQANALLIEKGIELHLYNMPNYNGSLETYNGMNKTYAVGIGFYNFSTPLPLPASNMSGTLYSTYVPKPLLLVSGLLSKRVKINVNNYNSNGSMDIVPGGTYKTISILKNQLDKFMKEKWYITSSSITWSDLWYNHSFIPSISSLAFNNTNFNWSTAFNNRNLLCAGEIPFDNYYTAPGNEEHVSLTEASANWAIDEIINGQPNCPIICTYKINGTENYMCAGTNNTFSLDAAAPANSLVQWSYSSGLTVIGTPNNTQITLRPQLGSWDNDMHVTVEIIPRKWNGLAWVKCGASKIIKKKISYGNSTYSLSYTDFPLTFDVKVQPNISGDIYRWAMDGVSFGAPTSAFAQVNINKIDLINAPKYFKVEIRPNGCALGEILTGQYYIKGFTPAGPINGTTNIECNYLVYPNPSETYWDISMCGLDIEKQIEVINTSGQLVASFKTTNLAYKINISTYNKGVYIIKIRQGNDVQVLKATKI